jgi:hypothetical protein
MLGHKTSLGKLRKRNQNRYLHNELKLENNKRSFRNYTYSFVSTKPRVQTPVPPK